MTGLTLDAGALIAYERGARLTVLLVKRARERGQRLAVPSGVVGQVWRDGRRQVTLGRLLASTTVDIVPLDGFEARAAGQLCGATGTTDVIDASVVVCARRLGHPIVTSDPDDMRRLDPHLELIPV